jgi:ribokinase
LGTEKATSVLLERGIRNVILKLGVRGGYIATADGRRKLIPGFKVNAVDTTAAGDAFNAFTVAISSGKDAFDSASWATAVAALSVTRPGAQTSMPSREEVEQF